jgi:hypothetical protein
LTTVISRRKINDTVSVTFGTKYLTGMVTTQSLEVSKIKIK